MNLENLINFRINSNITQKEMINILGVSKGTYSAWESGKDVIPLNRLIDICNYLNISCDYALGITNANNFNINVSTLDLKLIGRNLKSIRKENNLNLTKLANLLNTSISVISRYENGHTLILTSFIYQYAKLFNVSTDYILGRSNEVKIK